MNKITILIIVSLLLIAGCNGGSKEKRPITDIDIRTGTDGLIMDFTKNAPPERVFENSIFPIAIRMRNGGATDIEATDIKYGVTRTVEGILVFGFETTYVDSDNETEKGSEKTDLENRKNVLQSNKEDLEKRKKELDEREIISGLSAEENVNELIRIENQLGNIEPELEEIRSKLLLIDQLRFDIKGKSIFNPAGDEDFITLNAKTKKIGSQSETQPSTILATACYPYKTILGTSICIDTDIYGNRRGQKPCTVEDLKFDGQGAPVAITKIEIRMLPQDGNLLKPHFLIQIENKGNGEVVNINNVEQACTSESLDYTAFNTIRINATLSGILLDCRINKEDPNSAPPPAPATIRLRDKEDIIRCTLEPSKSKGVELIDISRDAYTTPLKIELEYGYTFTISKDIIIEKVLTY